MSFPRQRDPGTWTGVLEPTEADIFDEYISHALDGRDGGTYSLAHELVLGGAGLLIHEDSSLTVDGQFTVTSTTLAANFQAALFQDDVVFNQTVSAASYIGGSVSVVSLATVNDASIGRDAEVERNFVVGGTTTLNGTTHINGDLEINGSVNVPGIFDVSEPFGRIDIQGMLTLFGNGKLKMRVTAATDASATYSIHDTDFVIIPGDSTLTADRVWTIADPSDVADGMFMFLSRHPDTTAFKVEVKNAGGSLLTTLGKGRLIDFVGQTYTGFPRGTMLVRQGSAWHVVGSWW